MNQTEISNIEGVRLLEASCHSDDRGTFKRFPLFNAISKDFSYTAISINPDVATIRGLHFQRHPHTEEKLVTCISGKLFDVIVDLRVESLTYGKWAATELSSDNSIQLFLPRGIAHGYQVLAPNTIVQYTLSGSDYSSHVVSINPLGDLQITWPLEPGKIAQKDLAGHDFPLASTIYSQSLGKK
jgi:dTDP-4-dehydrorhamnose 3,5-epimerase